jgi:hypothetical protein
MSDPNLDLLCAHYHATYVNLGGPAFVVGMLIGGALAVFIWSKL